MRAILSSLFLLLLALPAAAQNNVDETAKRALVMGRTLVPEYVYMHFDNTAYYLGETMWFKAYVTSGNSDKTSTLSKVLYVELVAPEGYVVETKKYKLDDSGSCNGEFELNPLLLSGYYEVRAYTRYMLNRNSEAVFSRVFPIFDKVNANNWDFKNMLDRKRGFMYRGEWVSSELPECTITFFPEGGHLVSGITTRVAYELRAIDGVFGNDTVTILKDGKPLLTTVPTHNGKGYFEITPEAKSKYTAQVYSNNKKGKRERFRFDLPKIEAVGVGINITQDATNVTIKISNNDKESGELGFALLHRGTMGFYKKLPAEQSEHTFTLPKSGLLEGVTRAVVFSDEIPLAERQFFVMHAQLQKNDRQTVKLNVKGNNYNINNLTPKRHEKITISIEREDGKPIDSNAQFSLSVTDAAGNQSTSWDYNMYSYLLLGSELKGYIPNASQYFVPENKNRDEQLDLLMLTHGWTSYDWNKLTQIKMSQLQPIERGITLKGTLYQKSREDGPGRYSNVNIKPSKFNLTSLQFSYDNKVAEQEEFRTDSTGSFTLELDDFYGRRVGKLIPTDNYRHTDNVWYAFSLDRYYSPKFRLYDYWERNLGESVEEPVNDSLIRLNPFEYMLGPLEVVTAKKEVRNGRPPHSEMRFDYLDEWEYAQDITYLKDGTASDELYDLAIHEDYMNEITDIESTDVVEENSNLEEDEATNNGLDPAEHLENQTVNIFDNQRPSGIYVIDGSKSDHGKYLGNMYFPGKLDNTKYMGTTEQSYKNTLTAEDVVRSAMYRHNYNWAYWVQLMVVLGDYDSYKVPAPDTEYYKGKDPEKMVRFKEIVIRSDEKTRKQFENTSVSWGRKTSSLNNKEPFTRFYLGFLSQSYLIAREGVDNAPMPEVFLRELKSGQITSGGGQSAPFNPNYVACLIPQKESDGDLITPDFSNMSAARYTSIRGYNKSKQFYSPDYGKMKPDAQNNDYRRTLLWIPTIKAENGKIKAELYNSSYCDAIKVNVDGVDGNTFYSNSNMLTRTMEQRATDVQTPTQQENSAPQKIQYSKEDEQALKERCELGDIMYNQQKYAGAIKIYAELLQYNYPPAMHKIGLCHIYGRGLAKNIDKAMEFLTLAAEYGNGESMFTLAEIYHSYDGKRDARKATEWLKRAEECAQSDILAKVAYHYYNGTIVEKDTVKAIKLFRATAIAGNADGQYMYGRYMLQQGIASEKEIGTPIESISRAAEQSHTEAMLFMMRHHYNAQEHKAAYSWANKLHQIGVKEGTLHLAECYEKGLGVKRDKRLAEDLRREAK